MRTKILSLALLGASLCAVGAPTDYCRAKWPAVSMGINTGAEPQNLWNTGMEGYLLRGALMYADGNYVGATDQLRQAHRLFNPILASPSSQSPDKEEVSLLDALASQARGNADGIKKLEKFLKKYPASRYKTTALLAMGNYYFFLGDWSRASLQYSKAGLKGLNGSALATYRFRYALSLLKSGMMAESRNLMNTLRDDASYGASAAFYLAFLEYAENDYSQALKNFAASGIQSGWYEAQIAFQQGKWNEASAKASALFDELKPVSGNLDMMNGPGCPVGYADITLYRAEMARVAGESFFKLGDYNKARTWLERYSRLSPNGAPSAIFDLGAIAYRDGDYDKAASLMEKVARGDDMLLSENAWLYLGQCFARRGDNTSAALAFENAWRTVRNPNVGERAMYDYIVAIAKGGNVPFSSSAGVMEQFLATYPKSEYTSTVRKYLATAYYVEKDYVKALDALDKITRPDASALAAKQLVLYELGCMEQSNGKSSEAATHLKAAAEMNKINVQVAAEATLWLGQALYDQGKWKDAQKATQAYLDADGNKTSRGLALYDLAYAYYQEDSFKKSAELFDKAYADASLPPSLKGDALLRAADSWYYAGDYAKAFSLYSRSEKLGGTDSSYAAMRAGMMQGLKGDIKGKASTLEKMIADYPDSKWTPRAMLELASAYKELGLNDAAEKQYNAIMQRWPNGGDAPAAALQLAELYTKKGDEIQAVEAYKSVISGWPQSDEARAANTDLRRIMGSRGELQEYVAFMKSVPGAPKVDESEVEKIAFDAAEDLWTDNPQAFSGLEKYISDYPDGTYLAPALYDLAYSKAESGRYQDALTLIDRLLKERAGAPQVVDALMLKGDILTSHYPEQRVATLSVYRELEKRGGSALTPELYAGIMRLTDDASQQLEYSRKVLAAGSISAELAQEATYCEAEALLKLGRSSEGVALLRNLADNPGTLQGARAAVALGQYYIDSRQYANAQKELLAFTDKGTPHYYWLARGYIALADAYAAENNMATAREYMRALRDNYPGKESDIKEMINLRLNKWK